jgi:hypothetical protein
MNIQTLINELLLNPFPIILATTAIGFVTLLIIVFLYVNKQYKKTKYYEITKNSYLSLINDKGKYGEYLVYKRLKVLENDNNKFLFNIYLPRENNKTTEIDLLLISSKGLFVFESKNYCGWIFGNESNTKWTQVLYDNKHHFFNPIIQNKLHIKYLKRLVQENVPIYSMIVFSDKCKLKDITIKSKNVSVLNRYDAKTLVSQICNQTQKDILTEVEINDIYNKLYLYTQVSSEVKNQHIENIEKALN